MMTEARNEVQIGTRSTKEYKRSAGEELRQCDYSKILHYTQNILWRVSRMRELLKHEASKQKKNECLEAVPRWRA
jgi:hypothetical protein